MAKARHETLLAKARLEITPLASRKIKSPSGSTHTNVNKNDSHTKIMSKITNNIVNKN